MLKVRTDMHHGREIAKRRIRREASGEEQFVVLEVSSPTSGMSGSPCNATARRGAWLCPGAERPLLSEPSACAGASVNQTFNCSV